MNKTPEKIRDRLLNIIPDQSFQNVIDKLPEHHVQTLTHIREQAKESKRQIEAERERNQTIKRSC